MKKSLIAILILTLLFSTTIGFANTKRPFEIIDYSLRIGCDIFKPNYSIYINNDRTYIALRDMCDKLNIPLEWNSEKREIKIDIYNKKVPISNNTLFRENGVIPDEETALSIGRIILEKYMGKSLEYETDEKKYYLKATYIKESNSWDVTQFFDYKDGRGWTGSGIYLPNIKLNKNTGEVIYINTYSSILE